MGIVKFAIGHTYRTRSSADWNSIIEMTVVSRTEKTIRTADGKTLRPRVINEIETATPLGRYSMAPCMWADKENVTD